jgi:hypothetical protein
MAVLINPFLRDQLYPSNALDGELPGYTYDTCVHPGKRCDYMFLDIPKVKQVDESLASHIRRKPLERQNINADVNACSAWDLEGR